MRGFLVIHVGGYRPISSHTVHLVSDGGRMRCIPDRLVPTEKFEPGTAGWIEHGWAVGDNARDRFCKWLGNMDRIRRFHDYDEAVGFIQKLRMKRKTRKEAYTLVYVVKDARNVEQCRPVSFMDDVIAIDREIEAEGAARDKAYRECFPEIDVLLERYGPAAAHPLAMLLAVIRKDGAQKAMEGMARSTYYKQIKRLKDAGVM